MILIMINGRSSSDKSVTLRALRGYGFYCINNLLVILLSELTIHLLNNKLLLL
ncbi:MAG: RNase adapter RapZ [Arsenophonus sp. NC-QC1-MAG3]